MLSALHSKGLVMSSSQGGEKLGAAQEVWQQLDGCRDLRAEGALRVLEGIVTW